ncbi:GntR family transcriptional regulator [Brevibacterium limosum]|uniref:GntR family transcriptional regulator n=1 Tax=Brevibacterium limosum TaxID=2697565 RepID=UPI00141F5874|nr:GntR family transcriptional regulator [Brevibacterium limosum]
MPVRELDSSSGVPFYRQIKDILRHEISNGEVDSQTPITEALLLERFDVSRAPIRQALKELADEGFVYRRQGKGTFPVPGAHVHRPADIRPGGFQDYLLERGMHPTSVVNSLGRVRPPENVRSLLETADTVELLHFRRIISVEGEPLAANEVYVVAPDDFETTVEELISAGSVFSLLEDRYGLSVARAANEAWATAAEDELAAALGIEVGTPVLSIDSVFYARDGRPLGWRSAMHRPDEFKFHFVTGR